MTTRKRRAQERALLLGTVSLLIYLALFILPARILGVVEVPWRLWLAAAALTLAVQGLLGWILRRGFRFVERHDPYYLHLPVLGASLLLNFFFYAAPGSRTLGLFAWLLVLLFGSGRAGFPEVMGWTAVQLAGYLAVLFLVRERIADFSPPHEITRLWMFVGVCFGIGVLLERLRRWLDRARAERRRAERAAEERRQLEAQVQHLQRLESLGILAGGVAHDFNNILIGVLGNAELALSDVPEGSAARRRIERVVTSAERAAELVHQLLAYSGQGQFVVETIDLSRITEGVSDLISASISKKAALRVEPGDGPVWIKADPTQIHQVLMNLITNASDALEGQAGAITVTTRRTHVEPGDLDGALRAEDFEPGEVASITVTDDGCGMDAETRDRIFDPFFTTRFVGRGLGLAAVLGIVRGHRGAIQVDSEPGRGTMMRVLLPLAAPPALPVDTERVQPVEPEPARPGETAEDELPPGTFLVVDDDPAVREFVSEALERSGGTVLLATDGADGVDLYRRQASDISLVLLDVMMPVMNGTEAFRELRRIDPDVRVVMMSGFSEQLAMTGLGDRGPDGFLHKPYSPEELTGMICRVLAEERR